MLISKMLSGSDQLLASGAHHSQRFSLSPHIEHQARENVWVPYLSMSGRHAERHVLHADDARIRARSKNGQCCSKVVDLSRKNVNFAARSAHARKITGSKLPFADEAPESVHFGPNLLAASHYTY